LLSRLRLLQHNLLSLLLRSKLWQHQHNQLLNQLQQLLRSQLLRQLQQLRLSQLPRKLCMHRHRFLQHHLMQLLNRCEELQVA
jgi:hypothetical protein